MAHSFSSLSIPSLLFFAMVVTLSAVALFAASGAAGASAASAAAGADNKYFIKSTTTAADDDKPARKQCNALNAVEQHEVTGHYYNQLQNFYPVNDHEIVTVQQWSSVDLKSMNVERNGSQLVRFSFNDIYSQAPVLFRTDSKDVATPASSKAGSRKSQLHGMSNIGSFGEAVVVFDIPVYDADGVSKSQVRLSCINDMVARGSEAIPNVTVDNTFLFKYPLDGEEKIYDEEGDVVGLQDSHSWDSAWIDTGADQTQFSIRAIPSHSDDEKANDDGGVLNTIVMAMTQGSLKLMKYSMQCGAGADQTAPVKKWARLVMPRVETATPLSLGGLLASSKAHDHWVVVQVHQSQHKALKNMLVETYGEAVAAQFVYPENGVQVPFLFRFACSNGAVRAIVNLSQSVNTPIAHASAIDVRGEHVLIAANTRHWNDMDEATEEERNTKRNRSFYVRIALDKETRAVSLFESAWMDDVVVTEHDKTSFGADNVQFSAMSISFSSEGSAASNKFVVGGKIGDFTTPYAFQGRLSMLTTGGEESAKLSLVYSMHVGESGSNAVQLIRRFEGKTEDHLFLGLMMNLPVTAPPADDPAKDTYRKTQVGYWSMDCAQGNVALEQGMSIAFFSVFGVTVTLLTIVVSIYSVIGVLHIIRARKEQL